MKRFSTGLLIAVATSTALWVASATAADDVEIFRCKIGTRVVTQDKPCKPGQEVSRQNMTRPRDPVAPVRRPASRDSATATRNITYIVQSPTRDARPVYQCTSPEGERYTSETPEGIARWVPTYGVTYGIQTVPVQPGYSSGGAWLRYSDRHTRVDIGGTTTRPPLMYPPVALAGGMWVRDACTPLPQAQTCALLSDRRAEIRRKNVALQPSDRAALEAEAAGIDARLRADCSP